MSDSGEIFKKFVDVIKLLRDPVKGCPWDIKQTHQSIRPYFIEETYEVIEAIDANDDTELKAELGDVLLQVVLHAQIATDRGAFNISDIVAGVTKKMIDRHPHVFGDAKADTADEVLNNWEIIKQKERNKNQDDASMLAGVPKAMPALVRAQRLGEKASRVGFDWSSASEVWVKVEEELLELKDAFSRESISKEECIHELGDVLFSLAQLARKLGIGSEDSLRACCDRFTERFMSMETHRVKALQEYSIEELEQAWQEAKARLKKS